MSIKAAFLLSLLITWGFQTVDTRRVNRDKLKQIKRGAGIHKAEEVAEDSKEEEEEAQKEAKAAEVEEEAQKEVGDIGSSESGPPGSFEERAAASINRNARDRQQRGAAIGRALGVPMGGQDRAGPDCHAADAVGVYAELLSKAKVLQTDLSKTKEAKKAELDELNQKIGSISHRCFELDLLEAGFDDIKSTKLKSLTFCLGGWADPLSGEIVDIDTGIAVFANAEAEAADSPDRTAAKAAIAAANAQAVAEWQAGIERRSWLATN